MSDVAPDRALLIVVSAPSGAGKTTLCDRLREDVAGLDYSVSCTTRPPRGREVDGEDYFFLSDEDFSRRLDAGAFLEHAEVHGKRYGTLRETVQRSLGAGRSVVMDIDVQGAEQIRRAVSAAPEDDLLRRGFVDIFIEPPSMASLAERLRHRAEDTPEVVEQRLRNAELEMEERRKYQYCIVNDDLDRAYVELRNILISEGVRL